MITVMYLARIADDVGRAQEQLTAPLADTKALLSFLRQRGAPWDTALADDKIYKIAVNNVILHAHTTLAEGDIVALLPPVTGG